jgi:uncharacterized protein YndB with AHSA1/START domain
MPLDSCVEIGIMIDANVGEVWRALLDPEKLDQWVNGSELELNWSIDDPSIVNRCSVEKYTGDCVRILKLEPLKRLQYLCLSGFTGASNTYEDLSTVTVKLEYKRFGTYLHVKHVRQTEGTGLKTVKYRWSTMLIALKKLAEKSAELNRRVLEPSF